MTSPTYQKLVPPTHGTRVTVDSAGSWKIPDDPIACLLRGDGIGQDVGEMPGITTCAVKVLDAAVAKAYKGKGDREVAWKEFKDFPLNKAVDLKLFGKKGEDCEWAVIYLYHEM